MVIVDVLKEYCQGMRGSGDLLSGATKLLSSPLSFPEAGIALCEDPEHSGEWMPAKSCFDRPHHPPSPPPPLSPPPSIQHPLPTSPPSPSLPPSSSSPPSLPSLSSPSSLPPSSTPSSSLPSFSTPPQGPAEIAYSSLRKGTNSFSQLPYKEGGHKLGEGGFGEVFYCRTVVHERAVETAVKVLNSMVSLLAPGERKADIETLFCAGGQPQLFHRQETVSDRAESLVTVSLKQFSHCTTLSLYPPSSSPVSHMSASYLSWATAVMAHTSVSFTPSCLMAPWMSTSPFPSPSPRSPGCRWPGMWLGLWSTSTLVLHRCVCTGT